MSQKPKFAVFRADASPTIGAGHVMRCLTLADALAEQGWRCAFVCNIGASGVVPSLAGSDHRIEELTAPDRPDALRRLWPEGCDLLIVDHYRLDAAFETACRPWAECVLVIDDLADRPHDCDYLLDQTFGRQVGAYAGLVPAGCLILTGAKYALLRSQFAIARQDALEKRTNDDSIRRILVSLGSTDPDNMTAMVLGGLSLVPVNYVTDVVLGSAAPHLDQVQAIIARSQNVIDIHIDHRDMAGLYKSADIAIGAAGSSTWERCCVGLPSLMIATADNQLTIAAELHKAGAAMFLGKSDQIDAQLIADVIFKFIETPSILFEMRRKAAEICDGLGTERMVSILCP